MDGAEYKLGARGQVLLVGLFYLCMALAAPLSADDFSSERKSLDDRYRANLKSLADRCEELELHEQARVTRQWFVERDPGRQYIFLAPENDPTKPPASAPENVHHWHRRFMEHRAEQADALFALAKQSLDEERPTLAYQLLHETLRENPDHEEARKILGHTYDSARRRWREGAEPTRSKRIRAIHPMFDQRRAGYYHIESTHFEIATDHSAKDGLQLAERLEALHAVWRQIFFRHWSSDTALRRRFDGEGPALSTGKTHRVVLFRDRDAYVERLSRVISGIEVSQGLYADEKGTSYLYAGDASNVYTLLHEATHQLFQETGRVVPGVGRERDIWVIEGIAMYMESLAEHHGYWTLGGFDAVRMQYARYRALNNRQYMTLDELSVLGRDDIQRDARLAQLYSQSAGLVHFLMDYDGGKYREPLVYFIRGVYAGLETDGALPKLTGVSHETLDAEYHRYLDVTDDELLDHLLPPDHVTKLSLGHTSITDRGLARLKDYTKLEWLDLAFTKVTDEGVKNLANLTALTELNLEGTQISNTALRTVARLSQMETLDLSNTAITDDGLAQLAGLKNVKVLWLANTSITDEGLVHLRELRKLETLVHDGSQISADGVAQLKQSLPSLKD